MSGSVGRPARILVVEDEAPQRGIIVDILRRAGFTVSEAGSGEQALEAVTAAPPDAILCDWRMPGISGGDVLDEVHRRAVGCAFVVMTAYGSIGHAVEAMQRGADDYLAKPFERDGLLLTVRRALRSRRLEEENRRLQREVEGLDRFGEVLGGAASMQALYQTLEKVAATDATVLIIGESGTGKELVARALHARSRRSGGPFVGVNCAAVPESLMESELFGHEKGAFTGADRRREGKFEEAEGGTLFLDEVAAMPIALQGALLRVLQERRLTRVGGRGEVACDARIIAATNRDLAAMVKQGAFRDDLFYRLNVVPLRIPPLRERREDVPLLAAALLERACRRHSLPDRTIPPPVLRRLVRYAWPGNVRELSNMVERLALLAGEGALREQDLPPEILDGGETGGCPFRLPPAGVRWDEVEAGLLRQALELADGNRTAAARLLGMSYKAFLYRLEKHGLGK